MEITISGERIRYQGFDTVGWNLYVPGIRFGAHDFKRFNKVYAYVALPESEIWVFLRTAAFLKVEVPDDMDPQFVLVHDVAAKGPRSWDPPKGQVEYKEYETIKSRSKTPIGRLHALLKEGVTREVEEESKIKMSDVKGLKELNLVVSGKHDDLPKHFHYQYHLFEGTISHKTYLNAKAKLDRLRMNPALTIGMAKDVIEKDNLALWKPSDGLGMVMEGDPQKIIELYCKYKGLKIR
jgi:hypothetical protein